jgi:UDPglucose 6-dehydrogenase
MKKVSVIGIGRLGLSFALLLDSKGYDVMGCDVEHGYINSLNDKTFKSKEPYINELLQESKMSFTTLPKNALNHSDIIFIFVPTPSKQNGAYDHKYIEQVISKIQDYKCDNKTVVIGCTVMPRYTESVQKRLAWQNINVVYNPEFIAQGSIIDGLKNADTVLMGGENIPKELLDIYSTIMDKEPVFKLLSATGAEITKISINCFLTLKIAYANMIGEIAINSYEEENLDAIMDAIGSDSRVGKKYLSYGFPAGGVCLPRDCRALNNHAAFAWVHTKFLNDIDTENNRHLEYMVKYYKNKNQDKNIPFVFSYLGYKKGVDILTESYQLKLCIELLREGYKVDVPLSVRDMDTPEEFKDFVYKDMVIFGEANGYKIN